MVADERKPAVRADSRTLLLSALQAIFLATAVFAGQSGPSGRSEGNVPASWRAALAAPFGLHSRGRIAGESPKWKVWLEGSGSCPQLAASGRCFHFRAERRATGATSGFQLANKTAQVDAISITPDGRAVVLGRATANLAVVTLIGLPSGASLDEFMGWRPEISPDVRYVAYIKWYPPHIGYGYSLTDEYLAYDLMASPLQNRTPASRKRMDHYDVGWPLYPEGARNAPGDNVLDANNAPTHSLASDGFFWPGGGDTVMFVDRWRGVNRLVVADLTDGVQRPKVAVHVIRDRQLVDFPACRNRVAPSDLEGWSTDPARLIYVTGVRLIPERPDLLQLQLAPQPCLATTTVQVSLAGN
jgi:hypothetical protein